MQFGIMLGPADEERLRVRDRYRLMAHQARVAGAEPIFFTLGGLNEAGTQVQGWTEQDGQWHSVATGLPEVIYNRATYGDRTQSQSAVGLLKTLFARRATRLINPINSISKLEVADALSFFPGTAGLAPETRPLIAPSDLTAMSGRHGALFLKRDHGSHGSDVVRLRDESGMAGIRGRIGSRHVDERFGSVEEVFAFLKLLDPEMTWVVQQGIALPTVNGRSFDLRVIAQKDGEGQWQLPLVLVRLAREGHVAANMSQGGEPFLPDGFLRQFGSQIPHLPDLVERVSQAAHRTLLALESRFGLLGEVGIDIGVDEQGSTWVFEANTKPLHPAVPGMEEDRLLRYPFAYGAYLARQARAGRETGTAQPVHA